MTAYNAAYGLLLYVVQFANVNQTVTLTTYLTSNVQNPWSFVNLVEDELNYTVGNNIVVTFVSHTLAGYPAGPGVYNTLFQITGYYGEDITPYDTFVGNNSKSNVEFVYNSYGSLIANQNTEWDQIVIYKPDDRREVQLRHVFFNQANLAYDNVFQLVHLVPTRHYQRLANIVNSIRPDRIQNDANGSNLSFTYQSNSFI